MRSIVLFAVVITSSVYAKNPTLTVKTKTETKTFSAQDLLNSKTVKTITIEKDPTYSAQTKKYKAVPVKALFKGLNLKNSATIEAKALDGFTATLPKQKLLNNSPKEATAYMAIEPPDNKWPNLDKKDFSAGPFYLVWQNPKLSNISHEQWPYRLKALEAQGSLQEAYPEIFPAQTLSKSHVIWKGFRIFKKNCFSCHTMNKGGSSNFGPDLNVPMNPTEYFRKGIIKKIVRNPQNLRYWPKSRMRGFSKSAISEQELSYLIEYLEHMAGRKKQ